MSANARYAVTTLGTWELDHRSVRALRYAVGSTLALTVAMAFDWQLAYLAPVLTVSFLASPAPRPTLKMGIGFILVVAFSCLAGLLLGKYMIAYPLVFIPFASLLLLRMFYVKASGQKKLLMTMLLIALLVIPMIVMSSPALSRMVAQGILLGAAVAVGVVWLVHGLIPDPKSSGSVAQAGAAAAEAPRAGSEREARTGAAAAEAPPAISASDQFRTALISLLVVLPVFVVFYAFQMTSMLLILIFIALLSSQPGFATNFKMGAGLIIGNAIGGLVAIVFYEALVMVPEFGFLIILTLLAGLTFGTRVFTDKPTAKLYGMAYSTLLLVIGSVTAGGSDEASAKVYTRVFQIFVAVVYVVMAFGVADRFLRRKGV
jgi:hypothetical protein